MESLDLICIGYECKGFAGQEAHYPEPNDVLFRTGRFVLKEVIDRDSYLGDKPIWCFEDEECIW
jgi:hypothetical protein